MSLVPEKPVRMVWLWESMSGSDSAHRIAFMMWLIMGTFLGCACVPRGTSPPGPMFPRFFHCNVTGLYRPPRHALKSSAPLLVPPKPTSCRSVFCTRHQRARKSSVSRPTSLRSRINSRDAHSRGPSAPARAELWTRRLLDAVDSQQKPRADAVHIGSVLLSGESQANGSPIRVQSSAKIAASAA